MNLLVIIIKFDMMQTNILAVQSFNSKSPYEFRINQINCL